MKIIPLSEGTYTIDQTKVFIPFDPATDNLQDRPRGSLLVEIQPFLICMEKDILLLDTGLGFTDPSGQLQLHRMIHEQGIDPARVNKILLTHLHKDHSGGMSVKGMEGNTYGPAFPEATYYLARDEWEAACEGKTASYLPDTISWLGHYDRCEWLEEQGDIDGYIQYEKTAAHSPFHRVFWIRDASQTVFFGGDDAPQQQQLKSRFVAKYDYNGKKAMELRAKWREQGQREGWTFLFYHDIKNPVMRF